MATNSYIRSIKLPNGEVKRIKPFNDKKYIIIGDSYIGLGLGAKIVEYSGIDATVFAAGGGCFSGTGGTYTFLTGLQAVAANMTADQKEDVTDIFVLGGVNEYSFDSGTIATNMSTFATYVTQTFPHARVTLGMTGYATRASEMTPITNNVIPVYKQYAALLGWDYIPHANTPIHSKGDMSSDGIHPSDITVQARYIVQYILSKNPHYVKRILSNNLTLATGMVLSAGTTPVLLSYLEDGNCNGVISTFNHMVTGKWSFANNLTYSEATFLGTFNDSCIRGTLGNGYPMIAIPVDIRSMTVVDSSRNILGYEDADGMYYLVDDKLYLSIWRKYYTGHHTGQFYAAGFYIPQVNFSIPSDYC